VEIAADPGWLVLAIFGRVRIDSSAFSMLGPEHATELFATYFGG
jgi:hypothetical protein